MSERTRSLAIALALVALATTLVFLVVSTPGEVDRVQAIGERIKCPVCQGESIANSPAQMARDMLDLVAERVAEGHSDQAIIDELLSSYSGAVLLDPPLSGATLILWLLPVLALAVGAAVIFWWRRHPRSGMVPDAEPTGLDRSRLMTLGILAVLFAGIVVAAGFFVQERGGPASGVADLNPENLNEVSNETMEAVVAANADHPQVDGMRLALAERYFEAGDFRSAFPHYLAVADSPNATDEQAVNALVRLGWMAWVGNAEIDAAVQLFDQALSIDADSSMALYLKGQVLWCGADEPAEAAGLFEEVLNDPDLSPDSRETVTEDLDAARSGERCT